jgi:hypothetical protein
LLQIRDPVPRSGIKKYGSGSRIRNPALNSHYKIFLRFADIQIPRWKMFAMFCSMITFLFGGARLCEGDFGIPRQEI